MNPNMIYFSSLIKTKSTYRAAADNLFAALDLLKIKYQFIYNTKDIWVRDFMPVKAKSDKYISFRYEPAYLQGYPTLRTDYRKDISCVNNLAAVTYSDVNLDGGNVIFSPSKQKAIISDRVFSENPTYPPLALTAELEKLLETEVLIIPSLSMGYDMTGHADGMVRFLDEHTVLGNCVPGKNTLEKRIAAVLREHGINTIDFPYYDSRGISAAGCYLNYLETECHIFLPVFGSKMDQKAVDKATAYFTKPVVPVCISEIAKYGGGLNCISWEN